MAILLALMSEVWSSRDTDRVGARFIPAAKNLILCEREGVQSVGKTGVESGGELMD